MTETVHKMTSTQRRASPPVETFFRYVPVSESLRAWGIFATSVGYSQIPPGHDYPPRQHPSDHHFTWHVGRRLSSWSLVYITRGQGVFESAASGRQTVHEGDLFLLFPEIWHRYRPDTETGWDEHWIEFDGDSVARLLDRKEFLPSKPILALGLDEPLVELFDRAAVAAREQGFGYEYTLAGGVVQLIARILVIVGRQKLGGSEAEQLIATAKCLLLDHLNRQVNLPRLASRLGVSYTWFRRAFKEYTGFSPRQFQLHHRIHRAGQLLRTTTLSVGEIGRQVGFQSNHYFSELFKQYQGCSPSAYRRRPLEHVPKRCGAHEGRGPTGVA